MCFEDVFCILSRTDSVSTDYLFVLFFVSMDHTFLFLYLFGNFWLKIGRSHDTVLTQGFIIVS